MAERDELLAAILARLERVAARRDVTPVLEPDVSAQAERLAEFAAAHKDDLEAANLGGWLHWIRYQGTADAGDLNTAIDEFTRCFIAGLDDVPGELSPVLARRAVPAAQSRLAELLQGRADQDAIGATALLWQRIVAAIAVGDPDRPAHLSNLGVALLGWFGRTRNPAHLNAAIGYYRTAVTTAPADYQDRALLLSNLGQALQVRAGATGSESDLDEAIEAGRAALKTTPAGDQKRPSILANLGGALLSRFERAGRPGDLDAAIETSRAGVASTAAHDPERALRLANLGTTLRVRFERAGRLSDLDAAIGAGQAALRATPAALPGRAMILCSLGAELLERFACTASQADVGAAIEAARAAVGSALSNPADQAMSLCILGNALMARYEQSGGLADINEAVEVMRAAADIPSGREVNRATYLGNLGVALRTRFERTGRPADLDSAVEASQAALDATPASVTGTQADHARRPWLLDELGTVLLERFRHGGARSDLDAAIRYAEAAVGLDAPGQPAQAIYLGNLGIARYHLAQITGLTADQEATWSAFARAEAVEEATPSLRMRMAAAGGWLAARTELSRAADLMERAVLLLPETAPLQLERSDQQSMVGSLAGLASEAAALALAGSGTGDERAIRALRVLETGRAVLLSQALDTRSDLTDLRRRDAGLARRFVELRDLLDRPDHAPRDRRGLADEFDAIRARIRALDGFATFGLPPSADELRSEAAQGPVVVFSTGTFRCDALLLTRGRITALDLPGLTRDALVSQVLAFHEAVRRTGDPAASRADQDAAQVTMSQVLAWLWDTTAGPVLQALGYDREPQADEEWPRVWWAPGGLLGLLPIHAAGHHQDVPGRSAVMDRVISSYTPTVRALRYARQRAGAQDDAPDRSLIVAMPTAFQLAGFPSVVGTLWEITEPAAASVAAAFYTGLHTGRGVLDIGRAAAALHHAVRARRDRHPAWPFLWAGYLHAGA
jgi:tetratricopeptide (TPR) repeat protein